MKAIFLIVMLALVGTTGVALAQPAQPPAGMARFDDNPHQEIYQSLPLCSKAQPGSICSDELNKGMALLFWAFAAAAVGGALFVITRKNLIAAVMGMVGSFVGVAAIYMMLYANFLAVIQMLVYAGAIMVLFVFVIMILNRPEDEPIAPSGRVGQAVGALAIVYLVARLVMLLAHVNLPNEKVAMSAPPAITLPQTDPQKLADHVPGETAPWGGVKAVGDNLFGPGLFPFEAISILLLIAVVGAIAIARPLHETEEGVK